MNRRSRTAPAAAVLLAVLCLGCAAPREEPLPDPETARAILAGYGEEVRWVGETCGTEIREYTAETADLLAEAAMDAWGTERSGRLSALTAELTAAGWNGSPGGAPAYTAVTGFVPLWGVSLLEVPPGVTVDRSPAYTVELKKDTPLGDLTLAEPVSGTFLLEDAAGPDDGTALSNGSAATHRIWTAVLWGVVLERSGGDGEVQIAAPRWRVYEHLAQIAAPMYVERAGDRETVTCAHLLDFQERLAADPGQFL